MLDRRITILAAAIPIGCALGASLWLVSQNRSQDLEIETRAALVFGSVSPAKKATGLSEIVSAIHHGAQDLIEPPKSIDRNSAVQAKGALPAKAAGAAPTALSIHLVQKPVTQ